VLNIQVTSYVHWSILESCSRDIHDTYDLMVFEGEPSIVMQIILQLSARMREVHARTHARTHTRTHTHTHFCTSLRRCERSSACSQVLERTYATYEVLSY
jgi:hypothetical protein